jgi:hypothetical protein
MIFKDAAMKIIRSARSNQFDLRDSQPISGTAILSDQGELRDSLDIWCGDAEEAIGADKVVIDVDAIPGEIGECPAQAIDGGRPITPACIHSSLQSREGEWITSIERQVLNLSPLNSSFESRVLCVDD